MHKIIFFLLSTLPYVGYGQGGDSVVIIGHKGSIYSQILKETRTFWVRIPKHYENYSLSQKERFPVLFLLDGESHFNSMSGLVEILGGGVNGTHVIPDMIVVAIPNSHRTRDLTPTHVDLDNSGKPQEFLKTSGGGNAFLQFIKEELIPHIDSQYRTKPFRILVGHSFGGITVIQALYTMPETFNAYIAIDPSLWWDHQLLLHKAGDYFRHADLKGKYFFLGQANTLFAEDTAINEHFESIKELAALLETRNISGMHWKYQYYPDDDHGSVPCIAEYEGLRFIFNGYHIRFSEVLFHPEILKEQFRKFSEDTKVSFQPPEEVINGFGYNLLNTGKIDNAIQYFQLSIEYYPQSANAFDGLGEAWMKKGDLVKAMSSFQLAVHWSPSDLNAKNRIKTLQEKK